MYKDARTDETYPDENINVHDFNKVVRRNNYLEDQLERSFLKISNLQGELAKWKLDTGTPKQFLMLVEVCDLILKYQGTVFIPEKYMFDFKKKTERGNCVWSELALNPSKITNLTKNDFLKAKMIMDSVKFPVDVSTSPFLKTFNIVKTTLKLLDFDNEDGAFFKYEFSLTHGKLLGVFFPKLLYSAEDMKLAYRKAYGSAIDSLPDFFQPIIKMGIYAQAQFNLMHITTWQDIALLRKDLENRDEASKLEEESFKKERERQKAEEKLKVEEQIGAPIKKQLKHIFTQTPPVADKGEQIQEMKDQLKKNVEEIKELNNTIKQKDKELGESLTKERIRKYEGYIENLKDNRSRLEKKVSELDTAKFFLESSNKKMSETLEEKK